MESTERIGPLQKARGLKKGFWAHAEKGFWAHAENSMKLDQALIPRPYGHTYVHNSFLHMYTCTSAPRGIFPLSVRTYRYESRTSLRRLSLGPTCSYESTEVLVLRTNRLRGVGYEASYEASSYGIESQGTGLEWFWLALQVNIWFYKPTWLEHVHDHVKQHVRCKAFKSN